MFTTGKLVFAIGFTIVFVLGMIWSYKKDSFSNKIHFKGAFKVLITIILTMLVLFIFVKTRHLL
jgi:hypothetical protein